MSYTENVFTIYTSDKGFMPKIDTELLQINKNDNPIAKWTKT